MRIFLVIAVVWTLAVSCGGNDDRVVVSDADSGTEVSVASGEQIEVRLESNPSTGFSWKIDLASLEDLIELRDTTFEEPVDDGVVGAAGTDVFVVEAIDRGAGVLRFEYLRTLDDPPVPDRIVEYIIRIDDAPWPPEGTDTDPPATSTVPAPPITGGTIEVGDLLDGEEARDVLVGGFVIWDDGGARLCETIMESYPPQCGGASVVIADPEHLDVFLYEAEGVQWAPDRIEVVARYDGSQLVVEFG